MARSTTWPGSPGSDRPAAAPIAASPPHSPGRHQRRTPLIRAEPRCLRTEPLHRARLPNQSEVQRRERAFQLDERDAPCGHDSGLLRHRRTQSFQRPGQPVGGCGRHRSQLRRRCDCPHRCRRTQATNPAARAQVGLPTCRQRPLAGQRPLRRRQRGSARLRSGRKSWRNCLACSGRRQRHRHEFSSGQQSHRRHRQAATSRPGTRKRYDRRRHRACSLGNV